MVVVTVVVELPSSTLRDSGPASGPSLRILVTVFSSLPGVGPVAAAAAAVGAGAVAVPAGAPVLPFVSSGGAAGTGGFCVHGSLSLRYRRHVQKVGEPVGLADVLSMRVDTKYHVKCHVQRESLMYKSSASAVRGLLP